MRLSLAVVLFMLTVSCLLMEPLVLICVSSDNERSAILEVTLLINEGVDVDVDVVVVVLVEVVSSYDLSERSSSRTSARRLLLLNVLS